MNVLMIFLVLVLIAGLAAGAYAFFAPKKPADDAAPALLEVPAAAPHREDWTESATAEFDALGEAARCDFVFAVGALDDERSRSILFHALDDTSGAVALAAAHMLSRSGRLEEVRTYIAAHPRERSAELMQLLTVMT